MNAVERAPKSLPAPAARAARLLRTHWLFAVLAGAGLALRLVVLLAYDPALFSPDSKLYLAESADLHPTPLWPVAYPAFLRLLPLSWGYAVVPVAQQLLGIVVAAILYALLVRLGVPLWLAALAGAPALLDAYQLNVEEYVLSETLFDLFLVGGAAALLWRARLGVPAAALAALLFSGAALTRAVGVLAFLPVLVVAVLLADRTAWRRGLAPAASIAAVAVVLLGGYAAWYHSWYGSYALAGDAGRRIYGRVITWVECDDLSVPAYERPLCPSLPPGKRGRIFQLAWSKSSPINRIQVPPGKTRTAVASDFSRRAIRQQPVNYLGTVAGDVLASFGPTHEPRPGGHRVEQWRFQTSFPIQGFQPGWSVSPPGTSDGTVRVGLARFLRSYQVVGYTPGPLLGIGLLVAIASLFPIGAAVRTGLRTATFLFVGLYVALCVLPLFVAPFSWRYQLPQLLLIPPAVALAVTALLGRRRTGQPAS